MRHTFTRKTLIFFNDQPDFQQNNVTDIESEGTGGVTEPFRTRVVMPFTGIYNDTHHVLGHELVHVFQFDISNNTPGASRGSRPAALARRGDGRVPVARPLRRQHGHLAARRGPPQRRAEHPAAHHRPALLPVPLRAGAVGLRGRRYGDQAVVDVFRASLRVGFEQAIRRTLDVSSDQLSKNWADAIKGRYLPLIAGRTRPRQTGTTVIRRRQARRRVQHRPVAQPRRRQVAFFSSRGLFGIDLYIADARPGASPPARLDQHAAPLRRAVVHQHAGSWSPDGRRFAHVVYRGGDQVIAIYDVAERREERCCARRRSAPRSTRRGAPTAARSPSPG
jgi:hypothetical protein